MRITIVNIILCLTLSSCGFSRDDYFNYELPLTKLIDSLEIQESSLHILIDKSEYKLSILSGTIIIKEYPVQIISYFSFMPIINMVKDHLSGEFIMTEEILETAVELAWDAITI